ncbi:unknown protein [Microcystis aeruginosa NIES-843]|uniref:Uncharacterized protein n=1 Tax=Microcystis aeruginosa (strain NIES-843 / IAM M-2473) TaxID=449447 RepID=B0JUS3_MICAN|nr:unknown protein [Microcystis aeruginosa NIES-843]
MAGINRQFSRRFLAFLPRSSYDIHIGRLTPLALIAVPGGCLAGLWGLAYWEIS